MINGIDAGGNDNTPYWGYCAAPCCSVPAMPCYRADNAPPHEPDDLLCAEHAADCGYCAICGRFNVRSEAFNFDGCCEVCQGDDEAEGYDECCEEVPDAE